MWNHRWYSRSIFRRLERRPSLHGGWMRRRTHFRICPADSMFGTLDLGKYSDRIECWAESCAFAVCHRGRSLLCCQHRIERRRQRPWITCIWNHRIVHVCRRIRGCHAGYRASDQSIHPIKARGGPELIPQAATRFTIRMCPLPLRFSRRRTRINSTLIGTSIVTALGCASRLNEICLRRWRIRL